MGIDIVDIDRIARLLEASVRFCERWFTPAEVAECRCAPAPADAFAAHLAGKEAVWKALGIGGWATPVPWRDIAISGTGDVVTAVLTGEVGSRAAEAGAGNVSVSYLAIPGMAFAIALVEQRASGGTPNRVSDGAQRPDTPH